MTSWRRPSLQLLLVVGSLFVAIGVLAVRWLDAWQQESLDAALLAQARTLAALTSSNTAGEISLDIDRLPSVDPPVPREHIQLWSSDGQVILRSVSLVDGRRLLGNRRADSSETTSPLTALDLPRDVVPSREPRFRDLVLPEGSAGRAVQLDFEVTGPATSTAAGRDDATDEPSTWPLSERQRLVTLVVAKGTQSIDLRTRHAAIAVALGGVLLLFLIHWLHRRALHSALRPLHQVTRQMAAMGARNLNRLRVANPPPELMPLIDQLNALLDGLEQALARERRLSSNIAHELRTPIAELRNLAEVGNRWPDKREMVLQFFADVQDISQQMEKTVTHLLALARYESGLEIVRHSEVHIPTLLEEAWRPQTREAARKGIVLALEVAAETTVRSDADKLQLMVANLLGNAVQYSPPGSTIRAQAVVRNGSWLLAVINPAEHLQAEDIPLLFDRFWRKDPARTGGKHSGLGLSLVRAFGDLLGIAVQARLDESSCLHIELHFNPRPAASVADISALRIGQDQPIG